MTPTRIARLLLMAFTALALYLMISLAFSVWTITGKIKQRCQTIEQINQ